MATTAIQIEVPCAVNARLTDDTISVDLTDGRTISVPLGWYPRLLAASPEERERWRLVGGGDGLHWEELDEDISVEGLVAGRASGESQQSLKNWLKARAMRPMIA